MLGRSAPSWFAREHAGIADANDVFAPRRPCAAPHPPAEGLLYLAAHFMDEELEVPAQGHRAGASESLHGPAGTAAQKGVLWCWGLAVSVLPLPSCLGLACPRCPPHHPEAWAETFAQRPFSRKPVRAIRPVAPTPCWESHTPCLLARTVPLVGNAVPRPWCLVGSFLKLRPMEHSSCATRPNFGRPPSCRPRGAPGEGDGLTGSLPILLIRSPTRSVISPTVGGALGPGCSPSLPSMGLSLRRGPIMNREAVVSQ